MLNLIVASLLFFNVAGDKQLDQCVKNQDANGLLSRMRELVEKDSYKAVRPIADAVAKVEAAPESAWYSVDRHRVFVDATRILGTLQGPKFDNELEKLVKKHPDWPARTLGLYASLQSKGSDSVSLSLKALHDKAPQVVIVASQILGRTQDILVIEPLISAMKRWEGSTTRERAAKGGRDELEKMAKDRAWLTCRDSLHRLTGISLHDSAAYKSWISVHRDKLDPSKVDLSAPVEKMTGTGLFGLDITGKNIAFIIDISGSMMATDPPSDEQLKKVSRSTGVGESVEEKIQKLMESRRRILRAQSELKKAIEGLGENKRFTVIAYSTEVSPWSPVLKEANRKHRSDAVKFIESLNATGITVTDEALHMALGDPTVDTIYLITDGAPTHMGTRGNNLPPDAPELMRRILAETKAVNHLRGIRIFTLGFVDAEEEFLQKLAADNNGRYVRIR
ncbi:VWA domain-containing protein [Planctomycetota bacterium]|nr:VWA domain-containing protein [Planctomycetota bacterium]MDG2084342.1 VWA domain-containing protein [Planctomycetota bacterium]